MAEDFAPGALLGHLYMLADGTAVRLRLARSSDIPAVRELLEARGWAAADVDLARLVHFDPRRRYVLCVSGLVDSSERLLGIGVIDLDEAAEVELLLVAEDQPDELAALLRQALVGAANVLARPRAA